MSVDETAPPRLRPLSFGEILDVSFKICTSKAATLLKAVCVTVIPLQLLAAVVVISTIGDDVYSSSLEFDTSTSSEDEIDLEWTEIAGFGVLLLLGGITYLLSIGACFRAIAQAYMGHAVDWRASVSYAVQRLGALFWVSLLFAGALVVGVAAVLLVILLGFLAGDAVGILLAVVLGLAALAAMVWISMAWSLAYPALFVEDARGTAALKRSFALVAGSWWRVFGILFMGYLIASMLAFLIQMAIALPVLVGVDDDTVAGVSLNVASTVVGQLISTPLVSAMVAVVYFDQRVRKEGFDLELLARQIGEQGPAVGPSPAVPQGYAPPPSPFAPQPDQGAPPPSAGPAWTAPPSGTHPAPFEPPPPRDGATFVRGPVRSEDDAPPPPDSGYLPPRPPEPGDRR